jgi:hypothetical protein
VKHTLSARGVARIGMLAFVLVGAALPESAGAFCCPAVREVELSSVALGVRASGRAEINECLGMSFLHVVVRGRFADGTELIPVLVGSEPIMGTWFTTTGGKGEGVMESLTLAQVTGRSIAIMDTNYTEVLHGQF